jgi:sulfatase modifying factor 1
MKLKEDFQKDGLPDMIPVLGGTFLMGCSDDDPDASVDEKPRHEVTVGDFEIGKYPVTQKLWQEIMGVNPSYFKDCDDCPVECITWNNVQEFLQKLNARFPGKNYRMPTEAEWEYAARGGSLSKGYKYAGSDNLDEVAWYDANSGAKTHSVGSKKANELGLYDMSGNVMEWSSDFWGMTYLPDPTERVITDGPVLRGGSWYFGARYSRVAYRFTLSPDCAAHLLGIRLAASLP